MLQDFVTKRSHLFQLFFVQALLQIAEQAFRSVDFFVSLLGFRLKLPDIAEDIGGDVLHRKQGDRFREQLMLSRSTTVFQLAEPPLGVQLSGLNRVFFALRFLIGQLASDRLQFLDRQLVQPRLQVKPHDLEAILRPFKIDTTTDQRDKFLATQRGRRDAELPSVIQSGHRAGLRSQLRDPLKVGFGLLILAEQHDLAMPGVVERIDLQKRSDMLDHFQPTFFLRRQLKADELR